MMFTLWLEVTPQYDMLVPDLTKVAICPNFPLHSFALTAWAAVEDCILRIYKGLMPNKDQNDVAECFYSHRVRLKGVLKSITDSMVSTGIDTQLRSRWEALRKRIGKQELKRNELAHYSMQFVTDRVGRTQAILLPSPYDPRSLKQKGVIQEHMEDRLYSFIRLANELDKFADDAGIPRLIPNLPLIVEGKLAPKKRL